MKKLLLILIVFATLTGCSRDKDRNFSAVENFIGQWELQSRILNDITPVEINNDKLIFTDDSDIRDFKGFFTLEATGISSGIFSITDQGNVMNFEASNGATISYEFILNTVTLSLGRTNDDGDVVKEIWIKTSNFVE